MEVPGQLDNAYMAGASIAGVGVDGGTHVIDEGVEVRAVVYGSRWLAPSRKELPTERKCG
jgi:hypothetical protein